MYLHLQQPAGFNSFTVRVRGVQIDVFKYAGAGVHNIQLKLPGICLSSFLAKFPIIQ